MYNRSQDPETLKNSTKWISTNLEVKGSKKKAEALIPDMINKYKYLEEERANDNLNESVLFADYFVSAKYSYVNH